MRVAFWRRDQPQLESEVHEEDATYNALRRISYKEMSQKLGPFYSKAIIRKRSSILRDKGEYEIPRISYGLLLEEQDIYFSGTGWTLKEYEDEVDKDLKK